MCAERFSDFISDGDRRDAVKQIESHEAAADIQDFQAMKECARELGDSLRTIFFDSTYLKDRSRRYLVF